MTTLASPPAPPAPARSTRTTVLTVLAAIAASCLAAFSGAMGEDSKVMLVLPLAVATGVVLAVIALTRFRFYVLAMLVIRSSLDLAKLSAKAAGNISSTAATGRAVDPSSILAVLFLLAAVLWLAAQYRKQGSLPGSPLRRALVCFGCAGLLSIAGSSRPLASTTEALRVCAVVAMFVVLEQLALRRQDMRTVLTACYVAIAFPLLFTVFGFLSGHPRSEAKGSFTRITGPFNQSNSFGRYLMFMIIFGVAIYPRLRGWQRQAMRVVLGLSTIFLFLTYTRTALFGAVIGVVVVAIAQKRNRIIGGLVVLAMAALLVVPNLATRVGEVAQTSQANGVTISNGHSGNSLIWRFGYWSEVIALANHNPVTGIGLNMTQYNTDDAKQPHNDYLRAYVETGVLGLIAYLSMLIAMVGLGRRAVRLSPRGSFDHAVGAGFLGCAVAFVAVSAAANVVSNVVGLWYLCAFGAAASTVVRRQRALAQDPLAMVDWERVR